MLIDTHCHLTHERFRDDLPEVLSNAARVGVTGVIAVASDLDDARVVEGLVGGDPRDGRTPRIWGTAGVHPHTASKAPDELPERLGEFADRGAVALGECGLDYHYDLSPRDAQLQVLDDHVEAARSTGLPLVVHCREAEKDMKEVVRGAARRGVRGVLHCFPGDLDLLEVAIESDWRVSFTGLVTFSSFAGVEAVRRVPRDRYMLETDGPYMAPVPLRGRRNEPALVPHIRDRVAEIRGESPDDVERDTTATALSFFGIEEGMTP